MNRRKFVTQSLAALSLSQLHHANLLALDELILRLTALFADYDGLTTLLADDDRLRCSFPDDDWLRL